MARPVELSSFRRTFILLVVLVVLPSAGLSGFGVLAIVNERAAVEKRLEAVWANRLDRALAELQRTLEGAELRPEGNTWALYGADGTRLSNGGFVERGGAVQSDDERLRRIAATAVPQFPVSEELGFFSFSGPAGTVLLAAQRGPAGDVRGARVSLESINRVLSPLSKAYADLGEPMRFVLQPVKREPGDATSIVGKLVSEVEQARDAALGGSPVLSDVVLPAPLQDFRLAAISIGEDPIASRSTRNRALYGVLLGLFYVTLAIGVIYTARALYREAQISRLKTDFVSLVSHELRTPLTSIRMFIETLSLGRVKDPKQTQDVLELLAKETERLSEMIERVLDWARIESGRRLYKRTPHEVAEIVEETLAAFRTQRHNETVELTVDIEPNLPQIDVDREAIEGALLNLVQNAFKYGGAQKKIAVRARTEAKGVVIEVEDNGQGIPIRERKRIFDRFYRVDSLLTRKTEGSGLGLSIAQRLIEAHGGRITVKSDPGRGSTFGVHLPGAKPKREATA